MSDSTERSPNSPGSRDSAPAPKSGTQTLEIRYLRSLDFLQSSWNCIVRRFKAKRLARKVDSPHWQDVARPGRRFVRVKFDQQYGWRKYITPGWEWYCSNCHDYSIITVGMMPRIIKEWEVESADLRARGFAVQIQPKPVLARVRCPNCHFKTGDPQ